MSEYYHLGGASVRLEWYPRMDVLIEVEGDGPGIELALGVIGFARDEYSADSLSAFAARYSARTGKPALLALDPESPDPPAWESR